MSNEWPLEIKSLLVVVVVVLSIDKRL